MADIVGDLSDLLMSSSSAQLSQVIGQATAPVFLLGAVSSFMTVLMVRHARIKDRIRTLKSNEDRDAGWLKDELATLRKRAGHVHRAIRRLLAAGIATTFIIVFMFGSALLGFEHHWGAALLFTTALLLFAGSLVEFAWELRISTLDDDDESD